MSAYILYRDVVISQQTQEAKMEKTKYNELNIVYLVDRVNEIERIYRKLMRSS